MPRKRDDRPFTKERFEELMLKAAELVDMFGEEVRPILDYWKAHYIAARDRKSAVDEVRELLAEKPAT